MSAFNTISIPSPLGATGVTVKIQFKYGECRQHDYTIGDSLLWGGNDVGHPGVKHVVVDGCLSGDCSCSGIPEDFEVHIEYDRITRVVPSSGKYDFVHSKEAYIVVA